MAQPCLRYRNRRLASPKETLLLTKECEFEGVFLLPLNSRAKFSLIKTIGYKRYQQVCNSFVNLHALFCAQTTRTFQRFLKIVTSAIAKFVSSIFNSVHTNCILLICCKITETLSPCFLPQTPFC